MFALREHGGIYLLILLHDGGDELLVVAVLPSHSRVPWPLDRTTHPTSILALVIFPTCVSHSWG